MNTLSDISANTLRRAEAMLRRLPTELGNMAKNHFLEGFEKGGGQTDKSAGGWTPRTSRNRSDRRNKRSRAILVDSGDLRRDIHAIIRAGGFSVITDGTDYAEYHNEGEGQEQREFIGESKELDRKLKAHIEEQLNDVFK